MGRGGEGIPDQQGSHAKRRSLSCTLEAVRNFFFKQQIFFSHEKKIKVIRAEIYQVSFKSAE